MKEIEEERTESGRNISTEELINGLFDTMEKVSQNSEIDEDEGQLEKEDLSKPLCS
jgi:lipoate-protein ligase A